MLWGRKNNHRPRLYGTMNSDDDDFEEANIGLLNMEPSALTPFDKKSLVINAELDRLGMGRYQWWIFFLCGFGYFLDLLWARAYGLVSWPLQQEFGLSDKDIGRLYSAAAAGQTIGALLWGVMLDLIGRKWSFYLTCLQASCFGLVFGGLSNYSALCFVTFMNGLGVGGNIPVDAIIALEFLPTDRRFLVAGLSVFQPLGVVVCSILGYALIPSYSCDPKLPTCGDGVELCCQMEDNKGWRYLMIFCGVLTLASFGLRFLIFNFQESPKFLLAHRRDEDAVKAVEYVARFNNTECLVSVEDLRKYDRDDTALVVADAEPKDTGFIHLSMRKIETYTANVRQLFSTRPMAYLTLTTWIIFIGDYWGFSLASFLPLILAHKGIDTSTSTFVTYRNYITIYSAGIPGVLLGMVLMEIPSLGRKWSMAASSVLMAISLFLFNLVDSQVANIGFSAMEFFFQSTFNAILYAWTPEVFPANMRGSANGIASAWGRLTCVIAPLIGASVMGSNPGAVLWLAGVGTLVSTVAIVTLRAETRGTAI